MRGRPSVWRRTGRLEASFGEAAVRRMAARMAAAEGLSIEEVLAEARAIAARCKAAGAHTPTARDALLAAELGLSVEELRAEMDRLRERWA